MHPIVTKFYPELRLSTAETILGSKMKFSKIQDGRHPPIEIYIYGKTSKRLVQNGPILARVIPGYPQ